MVASFAGFESRGGAAAAGLDRRAAGRLGV